MKNKLKENSAVQTHINTLQNIINRMASNSANSKTLAITIISAIVVLLIDKSKTNIYFVAYIPLIMFYFIDCFYLGLERHFRKSYNDFINKLESDNFDFSILFKLHGPESILVSLKNTAYGFWSFSTTPFYIILGILIFIIQCVV